MFFAKLFKVFKRVDAFWELKRVLVLFELVIEAASANVLYVSHFGFLLGLFLLLLRIWLHGLHPLRSDSPTVAVHFFAVVFFADKRVDAKIAAGRQAHRQNRATKRLCGDVSTKVLLAGLLHELELFEGLLHLDDGASAVDQFEAWLLLLDEAENEGEQAHGFTCASRHLQYCVTLKSINYRM